MCEPDMNMCLTHRYGAYREMPKLQRMCMIGQQNSSMRCNGGKSRTPQTMQGTLSQQHPINFSLGQKKQHKNTLVIHTSPLAESSCGYPPTPPPPPSVSPPPPPLAASALAVAVAVDPSTSDCCCCCCSWGSLVFLSAAAGSFGLSHWTAPVG